MTAGHPPALLRLIGPIRWKPKPAILLVVPTPLAMTLGTVQFLHGPPVASNACKALCPRLLTTETLCGILGVEQSLTKHPLEVSSRAVRIFRKFFEANLQEAFPPRLRCDALIHRVLLQSNESSTDGSAEEKNNVPFPILKLRTLRILYLFLANRPNSLFPAPHRHKRPQLLCWSR